MDGQPARVMFSPFPPFVPHNLLAECTASTRIIITFVLVVVLALPFCFRSRSLQPLPPGPRGWPVIGNALHMPREQEWLTYTKWEKTYGPIVSLTIFGRTIIIINSSKVAEELLQKRSSIYSDRPYLPFAGEMCGWDQALILSPYGKSFRQMRRLAHQLFSPQPAKAFWHILEQETAKFLDCILQTPEKFVDHIRHTAGAVIFKISYGYTVSEDGNDPFVATAGELLEELSLAIAPGTHLVDFLPWLKFVPRWLPGATFRRTATEWRKHLVDMADAMHDFTKAQMALRTAVPSATSKLLEGEYTAETESMVKWTVFSMCIGGADSTVAMIKTFFLAMCLHPEVQATAQAELDSVVGTERLPTVEDRKSLPYIEAVMLELARWGPNGPTGIPHRLTQEDSYGGYRLPKGSILITNIWGIGHDADAFPKPDEFRPERFISTEKPGVDPLQLLFGFGRRVCPGQHLAEPSVFLTIAMTLATFTISKARDKNTGETIDPIAAWLPGIISHPVPFSCEIKPRSPRAVGLIKQTVATIRS